jgi:molybdopterin synthase catalytic subunit
MMKKVSIALSLVQMYETLKNCRQITKAEMERNEDKRNAFTYNIGFHYTPEQLVFIYESSFDRRTTFGGQAWAVSRCRAHHKVFFF